MRTSARTEMEAFIQMTVTEPGRSAEKREREREGERKRDEVMCNAIKPPIAVGAFFPNVVRDASDRTEGK